MRVISGPIQPGVATSADRSLTFAENQVPVSGPAVRQMIVTLAIATIADIVRVTMKAGGVPFIDCPPAYLRAYENFVAKQSLMAAGDFAFNIPMPGPSVIGQSFPQDCLHVGAPPGQLLRLELAKSAAPGAGVAAQLHQMVIDEVAADAWPYFVSNSANIPASAQTTPFQINTPGILHGFVLPDVANISLLRYFGASGIVYEYTSSLALIQAFRPWQGSDNVGNVLYMPVPPEPVVPGRTRLEISTLVGWAGPANEIGIHTLVPIATA